MTFPNFRNKHSEEAFINPSDFTKYKGFNPKFYPKKYLLVYQRSVWNYIKRKYGSNSKKIDFYAGHDLYNYKGVGLIRMTGIGAPHAVTVFEELIALGGKEFISIGNAGGLQHTGIFLCDKSLRDEGTSSHYSVHSRFSYPDLKLTHRFEDKLVKRGIEFEVASGWTTDAPYRETKAEVERYRKEGIATVEMESSALFAVGKFRKVKVAAAFVVSDLLKKEWDPQFHKLDVKKSLRNLADAAIATLIV